MNPLVRLILPVLMAGLLGQIPLRAESLAETTSMATEILARKQGSAAPIPTAALKNAKGVVIMRITKVGLVVGGAGGEGVLMVRNTAPHQPKAAWRGPVPVRVTGGSLGAQIGAATVDLVILLNSDHAVRAFTHPGKLEWNATASGTAGHDDATARAGGLLSDRDVTIYKETDGLYGGATIGGAELSIPEEEIKQAYGSNVYLRDILEGKTKVPEYGMRLYDLLEGIR